MVKTYTEEIPNYALSYLVNEDTSGLEDKDIENIDRYMEQFHNEAKALGGYVVIDILNEDSGFTWDPAFGSACDCCECNINIIY